MPSGYPLWSAAVEAWEASIDILWDSRIRSDPWVCCLSEACRGLTRCDLVCEWLMRDRLDIPVDLEPVRELYVSGHGYRIDGDTCQVYRDGSR